ncbi:AAA family ATPase [uncultured Litoreibacter sp.]|uniref:AAA family ATPase n=1 Tax=uncultured Litoreibacter sp. TaxID=1392394 RepID=UPI00263447C7|nr:AAA family ATPase [uncultured Litoreibacter sp.]
MFLALKSVAVQNADMLEELKIQRFKSVKNQFLQLGKVNIFIGGNGTGKSNLLEAIGLTSACLARGLGDSDIGSKGLRITPSELMKSSFKNEDLPKTLELDAKFSDGLEYRAVLQSRQNDPLLRFFSEASSYKGEKVFGRSNRGARATGVQHADRLDKSRGIWDQIKATYEIPDVVAEAFAEFSRYIIYSPQTDVLRGRQAGAVDNPPIGLRGGGLPEAASSFLDHWGRLRRKGRRGEGGSDWEIISDCVDLVWLPGWAERFGVHHGKANLTSRDLFDRSSEMVYFVDRFMHASRNRLSVYDSSEGTLFLLFAAIILSHPEAPRTFALDNVDNALNPLLTRRLVEQIIYVTTKETDQDATLGAKQVFLTSHNPTALDAFDLFDSDQKVFVVRRNDLGHTTATPLVPAEGMSRTDWQVMMNGRNLSQVWLDGDIPGALGEQL